MPISPYLKRIAPFYLLFLVIGAFTRTAFFIRESANLDGEIFGSIKALAAGALMDTAAFTYVLIPLALLFLTIPKRAQGGKWDKRLSVGLFFTFAFSAIFIAISEWFFWDEFSSRFNFISVDYLVYTHEVIGNIRESYPVFPLLSLVALLAAGAAWGYARLSLPPLPKRAGFLTGAVFAASFSFFATNSDFANISDNNYLNQIARNGSYEFFSAFRHNELPFERFYLTEDKKALLGNLHKALDIEASEADGPILSRHIIGKGKEKDYNIILLTVESLSANYMAAFGNKNGLTPNLDALAKESLFFTDLYAIGTRTVYGLSAITLSIPPIPGNSIVRRPENEKLFSLGSVLNAKGYESKFIYGGYGYFDNMNYFFENNGYKVVDRTDFDKEEIGFANVWGLSDEYLFNKVLKESDATYASGKPFFNMVMTTSNHRPFTYPENRIDIPSGTGRFGGVKYTDYAIGKFLAEAKTKPWFDKTIFVIVADHTAGSAGKEELNPEGYHIPMLIYSPALIKPARVDKMVSQIDVAPTLLSLLNMTYESRFYGQDILDESAKERAFISNYLQLGYMDREQLTVFKPVKQVAHYRKQNGRFVKDSQPDPAFAAEGLSLFQSASYWKTWNHGIDSTNMYTQNMTAPYENTAR